MKTQAPLFALMLSLLFTPSCGESDTVEGWPSTPAAQERGGEREGRSAPPGLDASSEGGNALDGESGVHDAEPRGPQDLIEPDALDASSPPLSQDGEVEAPLEDVDLGGSSDATLDALEGAELPEASQDAADALPTPEGPEASQDAADALPTPDAPEPLTDSLVEESTEDADAPPAELWPIPELEEEPAETCQAAMDDPWYFQFLDNLCDEKVWPTDQDRDRKCPVSDASPVVTLQDGSVVSYAPSSAPIEWDTAALQGLVPEGLRMVVILIKRVDGVPHYRYLSTGDHDLADQPWSTTKHLAAANAASRLRIASDYSVGLTASVGGIALGDLVTSTCNYDNASFTSNSLGRFFHDIGGRQRADDLIGHLWLQRPETETFGGNYGDNSPPLGSTFTEPSGATVTITPDLSTGYANKLSLHTLAESLKRLVLHREEPDQRLPGLQWLDLRVLLYGAESSQSYGAWGGMTQDTAIYIQAGHDMDYIEARSQGQWTIFSKLGLGSQGQFMDVGYACWPALDEAGEPLEGVGREFVIAAHLDSGGDSWDARDRALARAYRKVILRIVDGRL